MSGSRAVDCSVQGLFRGIDGKNDLWLWLWTVLPILRTACVVDGLFDPDFSREDLKKVLLRPEYGVTEVTVDTFYYWLIARGFLLFVGEDHLPVLNVYPGGPVDVLPAFFFCGNTHPQLGEDGEAEVQKWLQTWREKPVLDRPWYDTLRGGCIASPKV